MILKGFECRQAGIYQESSGAKIKHIADTAVQGGDDSDDLPSLAESCTDRATWLGQFLEETVGGGLLSDPTEITLPLCRFACLLCRLIYQNHTVVASRAP